MVISGETLGELVASITMLGKKLKAGMHVQYIMIHQRNFRTLHQQT